MIGRMFIQIKSCFRDHFPMQFCSVTQWFLPFDFLERSSVLCKASAKEALLKKQIMLVTLYVSDMCSRSTIIRFAKSSAFDSQKIMVA